MTRLQSLLSKMYQACIRNPGKTQHCVIPQGLHIRMRIEDGNIHLLVARQGNASSRAEYLTIANNLPIPGDLEPVAWDFGDYHGHLSIWTPQ